MPVRRSISLLFLFAILLLTAATLLGQETTGTIVGTVRDSSGAVMPDVSVTVRNVATNSARTVQANGSGDYSAPLLQPGTYQVTVERTGFRSAVYNGISLEINQTVRVDALLEVGNQTQRVEVTEEARCFRLTLRRWAGLSIRRT